MHRAVNSSPVGFLQGYIIIIVLPNPSYPATRLFPHVRLPSLVAPSHRRAWLQLMNILRSKSGGRWHRLTSHTRAGSTREVWGTHSAGVQILFCSDSRLSFFPPVVLVICHMTIMCVWGSFKPSYILNVLFPFVLLASELVPLRLNIAYPDDQLMHFYSISDTKGPVPVIGFISNFPFVSRNT